MNDSQAVSTELSICVSGLPLPPAWEELIRTAVDVACRQQGVTSGELHVQIMNDESIRVLNRDFLGHDYPTDVISFGYQRTDDSVEGELAVSVETAERMAARAGWSAQNELMLYAIHGALHCLGLNDTRPDERRDMREQELQVLRQLGIDPPSRGPDDVGGETC